MFFNIYYLHNIPSMTRCRGKRYCENQISLCDVFFYAHPLSDICTWWPPIADVELYSSGGLSVVAWLEGPTGRIEANPSASGPTKNPTFPVTMGTSYELISAVFGNGKMLVRLPNFSFHPPQELKARHKKKYGLNVPLVAFTQTEGRPLSLNFDIGR